MTTIALPRLRSDNSALIAPAWHTALLVAFFLVLTGGGALLSRQSEGAQAATAQAAAHAPLYLSLIAAEWGLFLFVWRGSKLPGGARRRELVTNVRTTWVARGTDALLALSLWGLWTLAMLAWLAWAGAGNATVVRDLLPSGAVEIALWIALSISAGVCEEVVFRGYFQMQLEALTRSRGIALVMQAALFGVSHGYQGIEACLKISLYGLLFGAVALWRKSLRPGIIAHAWTDVAAGLFRI